MSPENIVEICVALDIAILSIAYPIIIDKILNIGDKYSSEYIPVLFDNEFPQLGYKFKNSKKEFSISIFKIVIFMTLFSFIFLIFRIPPPFGWNNWLINSSAEFIVFFFTIILIVFFFIWLMKVSLYSGKSKSLLIYLIKKYNNTKPGTNSHIYHLKAINEIAFYAIEKRDEHLQETLLEFYYSIFDKIRMKHDKNKPLIYPIDLYFLVNKLNEIVVEDENKA